MHAVLRHYFLSPMVDGTVSLAPQMKETVKPL